MAPVSLSVYASVMSPRPSSVRTTESTLTARMEATDPAADRLLVGDDGEGLECGLRQPVGFWVSTKSATPCRARAHVDAPSAAHLAQFESAAARAVLAVEVGDERLDGLAHRRTGHRAPWRGDDALRLVGRP
jgi:hypothetical protein